MYKSFNPGSCFRHGQILQQCSQLHDEGNLSCRKIFPDTDGSDQGQRHQHICLDVKGGDQPCHGLHDNGNATENDGDPGGVKRKRHQVKKTDDKGNASQHKKCNIFFHRKTSFLYP